MSDTTDDHYACDPADCATKETELLRVALDEAVLDPSGKTVRDLLLLDAAARKATAAMNDVTPTLVALADGARRFRGRFAVLRSPLVLAGLTLAVAGLLVSKGTSKYLDPYSPITDLAHMAVSGMFVTGIMAVGVFFGACYVATHRGEHPDARIIHEVAAPGRIDRMIAGLAPGKRRRAVSKKAEDERSRPTA